MKNYIVLFFSLTLSCPLFAQIKDKDSVRVSLTQAEALFLKSNLTLLASQYRVSAAEAVEMQARLYNNPVLSAELAAYSNSRKWFDVGMYGQKSFGIDQLITLAGKRNKSLLLAKEHTNQARLGFYELMRTLKYELRQNFYTVIYANELLEKFDDQMQLLQTIIDAYDVQAAKKNVPLKDAVRLKTEYIQLSADRNAIVMESIAAQQILQLLMDTTATIIPLKEPSPERDGLVLPGLLEKAQQSRSDLRLQESLLKEEELNYKYQKALAVPDITIGAGYDQSGSYVNNFYSLRAAINLPLFNRNQGNIKAAGWQIKTAELVRDYKQNEIAAQVMASFNKLTEAEREYQVSQESFNKDFPEVNRSVIENFNKGNISLLEFIDFFENYNSAIRQVNQLQKQRRLAWEELEYAVGAAL